MRRDESEYSPAFQDEYQRLWHEAAAEAERWRRFGSEEERKFQAETLISSRETARAVRAEEALRQPPEQVARLFHEAYERLAPSLGYETRKQSDVPWEEVPEQNKALMVAVAGEVIGALAAAGADTP